MAINQDTLNFLAELLYQEQDGKSTYQIWLDQGNSGTPQEFLNTLIGPSGPEGKSTYDLWLEQGNSGTLTDFFEYLRGDPGVGINGTNGNSIKIIYIDYDNTTTPLATPDPTIGTPIGWSSLPITNPQLIHFRSVGEFDGVLEKFIWTEPERVRPEKWYRDHGHPDAASTPKVQIGDLYLDLSSANEKVYERITGPAWSEIIGSLRGTAANQTTYIYYDSDTAPTSPTDNTTIAQVEALNWSTDLPYPIVDRIWVVRGIDSNSDGIYQWGNVAPFSGIKGDTGAAGDTIDNVFILSNSVPEMPVTTTNPPTDLNWLSSPPPVDTWNGLSLWKSEGYQAHGVGDWVWNTPVLAAAENGTITDYAYALSETTPADPTTSNTFPPSVSGWSATPSSPTGNQKVWITYGILQPDYTWVWNAPVQLTGQSADQSSWLYKKGISEPTTTATGNYRTVATMLTTVVDPGDEGSGEGWVDTITDLGVLGAGEVIWMIHGIDTGGDGLYLWGEVIKLTGANGVAVANGHLYKAQACGDAAPTEDPIGVTYTFGSGINVGSSGWTTSQNLTSTASKCVYSIPYEAKEDVPGGSVTITYGAIQTAVNFGQAVIFSDLSTNGSSVIHGGNISTDTIDVGALQAGTITANISIVSNGYIHAEGATSYTYTGDIYVGNAYDDPIVASTVSASLVGSTNSAHTSSDVKAGIFARSSVTSGNAVGSFNFAKTSSGTAYANYNVTNSGSSLSYASYNYTNSTSSNSAAIRAHGHNCQAIHASTTDSISTINSANDLVGNVNASAVSGQQFDIGVGVSGFKSVPSANKHGVLASNSYGVEAIEGGIGPFTGAHNALVINENIDNIVIGDILKDVAVYKKKGINDTITIVEKTTSIKEKSSVGIFASKDIPLESISGLTKYTIEGESDREIDLNDPNDINVYNGIVINSVGEGQINVCGENGDLEPGDLITTSSIPGKGMKQDDDLVHNYTVAKCREHVLFSSPDEVKMVACIYMCG